MCLRADAPVFIPGAAAGVATPPLAKGDKLIQELAAAMLPPRSEPPRCSERAEIHKLPVAGVFCPYCIAGADCAFHRSAVPDQSERPRLNIDFCKVRGPPGLEIPSSHAPWKREGTISDSTMLRNASCTATSCLAFLEECALDGISEAPDSEGASTDAGASEAGYEASDTSGPSPTLPPCSKGGRMLLCHPSRNKIQRIGDGLRAYGDRYSVLCRHPQSNFIAKAR